MCTSKWKQRTNLSRVRDSGSLRQTRTQPHARDAAHLEHKERMKLMLKRPPGQPALSLTSHRCLVSAEAASGSSTEFKLLGKAGLG